MTDANLKIKVDSTDVKGGKVALDDLAKSGKEAEKQTDRLTSSSDILANSVKALAASYAVLKTVQYARDAALLSARYETLGVSMRVVGNNAGYTSAQMEDAAKQMQATGISMLESRQQAIRLVQAHIDLADASKLARIAQDAAVIGNINSSEAFSRLVRGIQTQQTETLRTIGITINMEQAMKSYAAEIGTTAGNLDSLERTQAITNAVFERGADIAGTYEAAMGTAGKQINSMARYQENLKLKLGETFDEVLIVSVMAFTSAIKDANGAVDDLASEDQLEEWGESITDTFAFIADSGASAAGVFKLVGTAIAANIGMTRALLEGDMVAFDSIVKAYDDDAEHILDSMTMFRDALAEHRTLLADTAAAEAAKIAADDLAAANLGVATEQDRANASLKALVEEMQNAGILEKMSDDLLEYVQALQDESYALGLSSRDQALFNAELEALALGAGPIALAQIRELTGANYDMAAATKAAEQALKDAARESERANKEMQRHIRRTREQFGETFADLVQDGEDAFDALLKSFERMLLEMAGQAIFSGLFAGTPTFGGSAVPGAAAGLGSGAISGLMASGGLVAGAGQFVAGAAGTATGVAAGTVGPPTAAALAGADLSASVMSAIGAIPGWGWALIGTAAVAAILDSDDGKTRKGAGFFVAPTPGADPSRTFGVDPFESGLNVTGFARRADRSQAVEVIDIFREVDATFAALIRELDGTIDLSKATLAGLDEEATAGSIGTFLGLGGADELGGDIASQINMFVDQLAAHVSGLDQSLLDSIRSASSADEAIRILTEAIDAKTEAEKLATLSLKDAKQAEIDLADARESIARATRHSVDLAMDAVISSVIRERDAVTAAYEDSARAITDSLNQVIALSRLLKASGVRDMSRGEAQAQLSSALAIARAGGGLPTAESLRPALDALSRPSEGLFSSFVDYQRDFIRTANDIAELSSIADEQIGATENQLDTLQIGYENELARLDELLFSAQSQVDLLSGISESNLSIAESMAALSTAIGAAEAASAESYTAYDPQDIRAYFQANASASAQDLYAAIVSANADPIAVGDALGFSPTETIKKLHEAGIPGYAVGSNFVERTGPAIVHRGETITPRPFVDLQSQARDETNKILRELTSQSKKNEDELVLLNSEIKTIRVDNKVIRDITEKSDGIGPAPPRDEL